MPDLSFLTDWLSEYPLLAVFIAVVILWARYNWKVLNNDKKPDSIQARLNWLREDRYGVLYKEGLGWLLDKVSNVIGDREQLDTLVTHSEFKQSWGQLRFGSNPWSEASFKFSLTLALFYPIITFHIFWAAGGSGSFGSDIFLEEYDVWLRWLLLFPLLALTWILIRTLRLQDWWRWVVVIAEIGILTMMYVLMADVDQDEILVVITYVLILFLFIFCHIYAGGFVIGFAAKRSARLAHREVYDLAVAIAFVGTFAIPTIIIGIFNSDTEGALVFTGIVAVAVAVLIAVAGATTVAVAVFLTVATSYLIEFAFEYAFGSDTSVGTFYPILAGAVALGGALMVFANLVYSRTQSRQRGIYWLSYSLAIIVIAYVSLNLVPNISLLFILIFYLLLPVINAPLDWLSLGVTRGLLQAIRSGHHANWQAFLWALADFVLALILLLLITSVSVLAIELANGIAGEVVYDLIGEKGLFNGIRKSGDNIDYYWIYFTLFSTVIPTLFHIALAGGAATLWAPGKLREWIIKRFDRNHDATVVAWIYISFTPVVGFLLVPGTLLYAGWWLISEQGGDGKDLLLDWMTVLANFVHGWFL